MGLFDHGVPVTRVAACGWTFDRWGMRWRDQRAVPVLPTGVGDDVRGDALCDSCCRGVAIRRWGTSPFAVVGCSVEVRR
jgi:hypothetical protein